MGDIVFEKICHDSKGTNFMFRIRSFANKMENWSPGRVIQSQAFYHDDIPLQLDVYPNGSKRDNEGYVSVYIINLGSRKIFIEGRFEMRNYKNDFGFYIGSNERDGFSRFFNHDFLDQDDITDGDLMLHVTVFKAWRDHKAGDLNVSQRTKVIDSKIDFLVKEMQAVKTTLSNIPNDDSKRRKIAFGREALTEEERNRLIPKPECPICTNEMTPNTRIAHCVSGHLICWDCKGKVDVCPSCNHVIVGRATGMENYLKTLFT